MSYDSYPSEKFTAAVYTLASSASIQDRLVDAYISNIMHIKANEIPENVRPKFINICEILTSCEPANKDEGSVHASARQLSDEAAEELASDIIDIYFSIESANRDA